MIGWQIIEREQVAKRYADLEIEELLNLQQVILRRRNETLEELTRDIERALAVGLAIDSKPQHEVNRAVAERARRNAN